MRTAIIADNTADILGRLSFNTTVDVSGKRSVADLFLPQDRCGIYVLHFADGEYYVGQARDVTRRYLGHLRTFSDITRISFKVITPEQLDDAEREVIWKFESDGFLLRNITFASAPSGASEFDAIMAPEVQNRWLTDLSYTAQDGQRPDAGDLRRRYRRRYEQMIQHIHADATIDVMRRYVRVGIPAAKAGEIAYWSVSCLPHTTDYAGNKVLARINIHWQETLVVAYDGYGPWVGIRLARSPLRRKLKNPVWRMRALFQGARFRNIRLVPGGQDQIWLTLHSLEAVDWALKDYDICRAIRLFNLRLTKKGKCTSGRYHCVDLADRLLGGESD